MFAEHQRDELTPQPAVAVLAAERTAVFLDQVSHVIGQAAEYPHIIGITQVEQRTQMHLTRCNMCIIGAADTVLFKHLSDFCNEFRIELRQNSGVFNDLHAFSCARDIQQNSQSCFSQLPHPGDLIGPGEDGK